MDGQLTLSDKFCQRAALIPIAAIRLPALGERRACESGATNALEAVRFVASGLSGSGVSEKNVELSRLASHEFIRTIEAACELEFKHLSSPSGIYLSPAIAELIKELPVESLWLKPRAMNALERA